MLSWADSMIELKLAGTFLMLWFFTGAVFNFLAKRKIWCRKPHLALALLYFLCGALLVAIWV